jgi:sulfur carrier protein
MTTETIIKLNGKTTKIDQSSNIVSLTEKLKLKSEQIVIELNKKIISPHEWEKIFLKENDELEVITFVGGG